MFAYKGHRYECFLSDEGANAQNPSQTGAIEYTNLSASENYANIQVLSCSREIVTYKVSAILVKGYITVKSGQNTRTLAFSTIRCMRHMFLSENFTFITTGFCCKAYPVFRCKGRRRYVAFLRIHIHIETAVCEGQRTPAQCVKLSSVIAMYCGFSHLKAKVSQYNALSDGISKVYTNADELTEYGNEGILPPDEVSASSLFVNGVLQPKVNYEVEEGFLRLLSEDPPASKAPVTLSFMKLADCKNRKLDAIQQYYVAVADGVKTTYTDADALTEYGQNGIPDPREVTYCNLYINAVLQPKATYTLKRGILKLSEPPPQGKYMVLESVTIYANQ